LWGLMQRRRKQEEETKTAEQHDANVSTVEGIEEYKATLPETEQVKLTETLKKKHNKRGTRGTMRKIIDETNES
jgi:hypothetical protein